MRQIVRRRRQLMLRQRKLQQTGALAMTQKVLGHCYWRQACL